MLFWIGINLEAAEDLLKLAGMAFSPNNADDLVVKFCLDKGIHDIPGINYMLYRYATHSLIDVRNGSNEEALQMQLEKVKQK